MSISKVISRFLTDHGGAAGIEFALLLPPMTLFVIGMVDLGCLAYQQMEVLAAADAGALYVAKNTRTVLSNLSSVTTIVQHATPLTISSTATSVYGCISGGALSVSSSPNCTGAGTYVKVTAQAAYTPLIAWSGLAAPSALSAQQLVRVQ